MVKIKEERIFLLYKNTEYVHLFFVRKSPIRVFGLSRSNVAGDFFVHLKNVTKQIETVIDIKKENSAKISFFKEKRV